MQQFKIYSTTKNNRNYYYVRFKSETGKWLTKFAPVSYSTESEVQAWFLLHFMPQKNAWGQSPDSPVIKTIATVAPLWLRYRENDPNVQSFRGHLDNWILKNPIAHMDLETGQEPKICRDFIRSIDRAPFTVRNVVQTIRTLIDDARKEKWIDFKTVNLFRDVIVTSCINDGKTVTKVIGEENVITLEKSEVQQLLSCRLIAEDRIVRYTLAIASGLRNGELSGLQWRDLDLDAELPLVRVERALRRTVHPTLGQFKPPKKNSYRSIPLHRMAVELLKRWKESGWERFVGLGSGELRAPTPEDAVFPNGLGHFYEPNSAIFFRKDLKKAGLSQKFKCVDGSLVDFDFHTTRRTFASLMEMEVGCERAKISALLGHKAGGVTAKHYLTKNKAFCAEAVQKLPLQKE